jgi:hypothetical protein
LDKKDWPNIVFANKEVLRLFTPQLRLGRAMYILKPTMLKLHACHRARTIFVNRLLEDIPYRKKFLFVHEPETGPTHICWRKVPPCCLSIFTGLSNIQRLLSREIDWMTLVLEDIHVDRYEWILNNVKIINGTIRLGV